MDMWLIILIIAVLFLVLEMFTPTLFFINLSVAAAVASFFSYCGYSGLTVTIVFLFVAIATIGLVRPILLKRMNSKEKATGLEDKYIGKLAKVVQEVTKTSGRVAIYGEEWQAKLLDTQDENIPVGEEVKIVSNDSIIFTVEKIKEN